MGNYILQIVVFLLAILAVIFWNFSGIKNKWERALTLPFILIAAGTPIIFTSLTRSVFEVSKLLNFRLNLIAIFLIIVTRTIIKKEPIKLQKNPINYALLAFAIVNILSTIFSANHYVALIGAYDRWEGLITELNYILYVFFFINFVKNKKAIYWMTGVLLASAILSGFYGMMQSFGIDFMNWSADAQPRAFGCINNPVHYAPYIIMHIPMLAGLLFHFIRSHKPENLHYNKTERFSIDGFIKSNKLLIFIWIQIISLIMLFYAGPLISFGRAAWIGFAFSLSFLLYFLFTDFKTNILLDFVFILYANLISNALFVFEIHRLSSLLSKFTTIAVSSLAIFFLFLLLRYRALFIRYLVYLLSTIFAVLLQFTTVEPLIVLQMFLITLGIIYLWSKYSTDKKIEKKLKIGFIFILFLIPTVLSLNNLYISLQMSLNSSGFYTSQSEKWKEIYTGKNPDIEIDKQAKNVFRRTSSYSRDSNNARMSMWKSAIVWWLDGPRNFLLGTGPGTIKEMYPKYRRADYGRLEGGQNFTPDKLHNDYFNMLVTRGFLGFAVYYLWLIPLTFFIILKRIHEDKLNNGTYILAGLFAGMFAYLGQVLFNFGVVATRVIFYEFFCLSLVIVFYNPFKTSIDSNNENELSDNL